jgi:hypothetical protein
VRFVFFGPNMEDLLTKPIRPVRGIGASAHYITIPL